MIYVEGFNIHGEHWKRVSLSLVESLIAAGEHWGRSAAVDRVRQVHLRAIQHMVLVQQHILMDKFVRQEILHLGGGLSMWVDSVTS